MTTTDLHALSGAYALDAVDDIERAAFTRHLAECEACTAEVAEFREVAALLGELAEQPPPVELRSTVLTEVNRTRQASPAKKATREVDAGARAAQRWRRATVASIAAAVLAVVGTWAWMNDALNDERGRVSALQANQDRIYAVMNARDVVMRGANLPKGGRVAAAVSAEEHGGVAMIAGLALPPAGEVYQMWLMSGPKALSSALVIPPDATGGTMLFDKWVPGADTIGITVEPSGGSPSPTSAPLTTFKLA